MPVVVWKNIGVLRGLAILLVVVNHATVTVLALRQPLGPLESSALNAPEAALRVLASGLSRVCVPAFLFASGFLMLRFCTTWKGAWGALRPLAARYLLWSGAGYAIAWAVGRATPGAIPLGVLTGGPFAAYWFLVLMLQLYLLAPLLGRWVRRGPRSVLVALVGLQLLASGLHYLERSPAGDSAWIPSGQWVFIQAPFFLFGMLFSAHLAALQAFLREKGRLIAALCLGAGVALCLEGLLLGRLWAPEERLAFVSGGQSVFVILFSLGLILALARMQTRRDAFRGWLETVGARSLGILLTTDLFLQALLRLFWHASARLTPAAGEATLPAPWLEPFAVWLLPLFVAAGVLGPLLLIRLTGNVLGRRVQAFLFG